SDQTNHSNLLYQKKQNHNNPTTTNLCAATLPLLQSSSTLPCEQTPFCLLSLSLSLSISLSLRALSLSLVHYLASRLLCHLLRGGHCQRQRTPPSPALGAQLNIKELRDLIQDKYAIMCVQHDYTPKESTNMDGAVQTVYPRKNWSSMVLYNCGHPKKRVLRHC
ncbi:hypothetical protein PIB30_094440, partial [Stylosanthes scabra]|nr:hypothetical protein [Stylosanthes scabra]